MADADRCLAFMRALEERRVRRVVPFRYGRAYFDDDLPRAPQLNAVVVDVDARGEWLAPGFVARGWKAMRNVVMVHRPSSPFGYARAVVAKAADESRAMGHDLTFLMADEDDWPKALYAKLGFERVARVWAFGTGDLV